MKEYLTTLQELQDCKEETILELAEGEDQVIAYRVTTFEWTVTGHCGTWRSEGLHKSFNNYWRVIRESEI